MASEDTPQVGDQVSWQYSSAHPTGELAEKKTEGDLTIQSKRGNTIKRKGSPSDPAVHVAREGNDVVKKQSEVEVEEKGSGNATDGAMSKAEEAKADEDKGVTTNGEKAKSPPAAATTTTPAKSTKKGEKRKAEDEAEKEAPAKKGRGRPKMSEEDKAAKKAEKKAPKEKVEKEKPAGEKKGRGRPKKDASAPAAKKTDKPAWAAAKKMKPKAPPVKGSMGTRTRSSK